MKTWSLHPEEWYPVLTLARYNQMDESEGKEFSDDEIAELRALESKLLEWQNKIAERFGVRKQNECYLVYEESS